MKKLSIEWICVAICFLAIITALVFFASAFSVAKTIQFPVPASTNWSAWGATKITSGEWNGTTVWQMRTNLDTGQVELRGQTASAHGDYHSK